MEPEPNEDTTIPTLMRSWITEADLPVTRSSVQGLEQSSSLSGPPFRISSTDHGLVYTSNRTFASYREAVEYLREQEYDQRHARDKTMDYLRKMYAQLYRDQNNADDAEDLPNPRVEVLRGYREEMQQISAAMRAGVSLLTATPLTAREMESNNEWLSLLASGPSLTARRLDISRSSSSIGSVPMQQREEDSGQTYQVEECCICLNAKPIVRASPCGHVFACPRCAALYLASRERPPCPICRREIITTSSELEDSGEAGNRE